MRRIKRVLLLLFLIASLNKVSAAPVNTSFTDDDFYNCIIIKLNTDGFNSVYDRDPLTYKVTTDELESITVLKCNETTYDIKNVEGISLLKNLKDLNLSDNNIQTIDLSKNIEVTNLLLSNNKLTSIDLSKNTALENLYLNGNDLTKIDLTNNKNLLVLNVNDNKLTTIDLTNNNKIMDLKALNLVGTTNYLYNNTNISLQPMITWPNSPENSNVQDWQVASWATKDANIATVNQKGLVTARKSGNVLITTSVDNVYSCAFNVIVSEITSEKYNIDETNATISVDESSISNIISNLKITNGEAMIYNTNNKYVTTGNISDGYKLKILHDTKVLKTYTLSVVKTVVNNDLDSIDVKNYVIDFAADKTTYTVIVENNVEELEIVATAKEPTATVKVEVPKPLIVGSNEAKITVTGTDKTTKVYVINIIKKAAGNDDITSTADVYLKTLDIENYKIDFDKKVDNYVLKVDYDLKILKINAEPSDDQANVEIVGNNDLKDGSKIEIKVTSLDGTTKIYSINISKENDNLNKTIIAVLELFALLLLIVLCVVMIIRYNRKKKGNVKAKKVSKKKNKKDLIASASEETATITDGEHSIEVTEKQIKDYTKSEAYLEKTIRFRRVCPHCGTVNVLTNEKCYMCGKKIGKE